MVSFFMIAFVVYSVAYIAFLIATSVGAFMWSCDLTLNEEGYIALLTKYGVFQSYMGLMFLVLYPLLLMILIARLHYTFHASAYRVNPCLIRFFWCSAVFIQCNLLTSVILWSVGVEHNGTLFYIAITCMMFASALYVILSVCLVMLFGGRLYRIIRDQESAKSTRNVLQLQPLPESASAIVSDTGRRSSVLCHASEIRLTQQQLKFVALTAKYTVIACIALGSTVLLIVIGTSSSWSITEFHRRSFLR